MILKIHPKNPGEREIGKVVECLKDGGIIAYPTDTVYGLGCDIYNDKAVEQLARIKGVKPEKANFTLICTDLSHLSDFSRQLPNNIFKLMKKALPGPFTFILNANNNVPKLFKSNKKTIGIRVPDNNIPRTIVKALGNPIINTSIHDDDEITEYITDPELIHERYKKLVAIVINGGFGSNEPSTIIDCTGDDPKIIRQGIGVIEGYLLV